MIQITRKPVKVFRSTDDQAPQLSASVGSLRTLLEACLVTGYGNKPSLDWEMLFSDAQNAAFKSKAPDSTGCFLRIQNEQTKAAKLKGFQTLTNLSTGTGEFECGENFPYYGSKVPKWYLIGHEKAFWLFIENKYRSNPSSIWLYFGDFPTYAPADQGNCLIAHPYTNYSSLNEHDSLATFTNTSNASICRATNQLNFNAEARFNSPCFAYRTIPYPDPIMGGFQAAPIDIHEKISDRNVMRGYLPGLYACAHDLSSFDEGTEISQFDNSDDIFLKFNLKTSSYGSDYFLINTVAWVA